jgi:hypothetical protein
MSHTCTYMSVYDGRGKNKHSILFYSILNKNGKYSTTKMKKLAYLEGRNAVVQGNE